MMLMSLSSESASSGMSAIPETAVVSRAADLKKVRRVGAHSGRNMENSIAWDSEERTTDTTSALPIKTLNHKGHEAAQRKTESFPSWPLWLLLFPDVMVGFPQLPSCVRSCLF